MSFFEGFARGALKGTIDVLDGQARAKAEADKARREEFQAINIHKAKLEAETKAIADRAQIQAEQKAAANAKFLKQAFGTNVDRASDAQPVNMEDTSPLTVPKNPVSTSFDDMYPEPIQQNVVSGDSKGLMSSSEIASIKDRAAMDDIPSPTPRGYALTPVNKNRIAAALEVGGPSAALEEEAAIRKEEANTSAPSDITGGIITSLEEQGLVTEKAKRFYQANPIGSKEYLAKSKAMTKYLNSSAVQDLITARKGAISRGIVAESIIDKLHERDFQTLETTVGVVDDAVMAARAYNDENIGAFNRASAELGLLQKTLMNYTGAMSNYELKFFTNSVLSLYRSKSWNKFQANILVKTAKRVDDEERYRNSLLDQVPSKAVVDDMLKEYRKNIPLTAIDKNGIPRAVTAGDVMANGDVVPTIEEYFALKKEGKVFKVPQHADRFIGQDAINEGKGLEASSDTSAPVIKKWSDL